MKPKLYLDPEQRKGQFGNDRHPSLHFTRPIFEAAARLGVSEQALEARMTKSADFVGKFELESYVDSDTKSERFAYLIPVSPAAIDEDYGWYYEIDFKTGEISYVSKAGIVEESRDSATDILDGWAV